MNILVLHGPNLNLLGERKSAAPGRTLEWVDAGLRRLAESEGASVKTVQSNHEGALVDALHQARAWADAVLVNADALAVTGHVLREALAIVGKPAVEVQLRRRKSVLKDVCTAQVVGKDPEVYFKALERLFGLARPKAKRGSARAVAVKPVASKPSAAKPTAAKPARVAKTLGRKKPATATPAASLGRAVSKGASASPSSDFLSRALVREQIALRLSGKLTPSGLSTWARSQWLDVQRGAAAESGQRELLEDALQQLVLHGMPPAKMTDAQLVELMAQLEG